MESRARVLKFLSILLRLRALSVEDTVETDVLAFTSVGTQPASAGMIGTLCFIESKAKVFQQFTNLVLTSHAFPGVPSRESVQGLVKTCLEMCAVALTEVYSPAIFNERLMQLGLSKGRAEELGTGWNLDTKSRRDKCSSEPANCKTEKS